METKHRRSGAAACGQRPPTPRMAFPAILLVAAAAVARPSAALMPPEWNLPGLPPAWGAGAVGNHRCVAIPSTMQMCAGIGYTEMRLPNMLNHESAKEVQDQTEHWLPLVNTACHREIRVLLCSIYAPVCIKHLPEKSIKPCRTLCQAVKASCLAIMEKFGFAWPDMLNCTQFPPEHDLMCIKRPLSLSSVSAQSGECQACVREPTYESLVSSYCLNDIVLKTRINSVSPAVETSQSPAAALRLQFKGRQRFFSSGPLQTARQKRQLTGGRVACAAGACPVLAEAGAHPKRRYLIVGSLGRDGATLEVKLVAEWNTRRQAFRRAVRSIRRDARQKARGGGGGGLCRAGQKLLRIRTPPGVPGAPGGRGAAGNAGRGGGGGGGRRGGRRRQRKKRRGRKRRKKKGGGDGGGSGSRRRRRKRPEGGETTAAPDRPRRGRRRGGP